MSTSASLGAYPYEALVLRLQWELRAQQAAIGPAQRRLAAFRLDHQRLSEQRNAVLATVAASSARFDPVRRHLGIHFLGNLDDQLQAQQEACEAQAREADALAARCRELQARLDAHEAHRRRWQAEQAQAVARRQSNELDHLWLARHVTNRGKGVRPEGAA